jgi:hypothetical protein
MPFTIRRHPRKGTEKEVFMKLFWTIITLCMTVPALSAMAASDHPTVPTTTLTEKAPAAVHAFNGFSLKERQSVTQLSDAELAAIEGQGTIDISILVFSGSVLSLDRFMSNPGPLNVGIIQVLPPSSR